LFRGFQIEGTAVVKMQFTDEQAVEVKAWVVKRLEDM
jgi:hypothetical protein